MNEIRQLTQPSYIITHLGKGIVGLYLLTLLYPRMESIDSAPLSTVLKELLSKAGISQFSQLRGIKVADLARVLKVPTADAAAFKKDIDLAAGWEIPVGSKSAFTALELIQDNEASATIATFCKELDGLLGGGLQLGDVTELCGVPGIGKTQLCMQIALNVQIPVELAGVEGEAVYIDTEGSFMATRLQQMAAALSKHVHNLATKRHSDNAEFIRKVTSNCTVEALMSKIYVYRCTDLSEQTASIMSLDTFLAAHPHVKVVILDSVAFHYRYMDADMAARSRHLQQVSQQLHRIATLHRVAVLVVNQMTTKMEGSSSSSLEGAALDGTLCAALPDGGSGSRLVPALGEVWAHACTHRVLLGWSPRQVSGSACRLAQLVKSPSFPPGFVKYAVTTDGIRSIKADKSAAMTSQGSNISPHTALEGTASDGSFVAPPVSGMKRKLPP